MPTIICDIGNKGVGGCTTGPVQPGKRLSRTPEALTPSSERLPGTDRKLAIHASDAGFVARILRVIRRALSTTRTS